MVEGTHPAVTGSATVKHVDRSRWFAQFMVCSVDGLLSV